MLALFCLLAAFCMQKIIPRGEMTMEIFITTRTLKRHFGARPPTTLQHSIIGLLEDCSIYSSKKERFVPNSS